MAPQHDEASSTAECARPPRPHARRGWWVLAISILAGAGLYLGLLRAKPTDPHTPAPAPATHTQSSATPMNPSTCRLFYAATEYDEHAIRQPKLYTVKADGSGKVLLTHPGGEGYCTFESVSPDGRLVAYTDGTDISRQLYVSEPDGAHKICLDDAYGTLDHAIFSPDGKQLAYRKTREDHGESYLNLYLATIDGTTKMQITNIAGDDDPIAFSADGSSLAFTRTLKGTSQAVMTMELDLASGKSHEIATTAIPKLPGPDVRYAVTTRNTGKTIHTSVDGADEQIEETVDTLLITNPATGDEKTIARGYQITVLGWAKE